MNWPWSPSDFAKDAEVVTQADLNAILYSIAPDSTVDDEYEHFLQPSEEAIKALIAKHWDNSWIHYGSIAPGMPLCYDYAYLCAAKVREICIKEGIMRMAFGVLRYTKTTYKIIDGEKVYDRHAICFVVLNNCHILYFEPQPTAYPWMDSPQLPQSVDNLDI